jgi:hypothetical protein
MIGRTVTPIVSRIIAVLDAAYAAEGADVDNALLDAAFLFEKASGLPPSAWSDEVLQATPTPEAMARLRHAVVAFVERTAVGTWTLSKCNDPTLKPLFVALLRRQLHGDAGVLFQTMIALSNLGERIFPTGSASILDEELNRTLAGRYLASI